jgi:hypothetical protein
VGRGGDCAIERRNELVTGREDATIFSGLNIVLTKLYQMDIPSKTGYLTLISGFQFDIQWGLTYINIMFYGFFI